MKSKKLVVIICMLVTASVFPIVTSSLASDGNIIYVNDDAPPEWYDATHVRTIQEGIDIAYDGDTVFVYSGTYHEHINIKSKSIILQGETKETTIIDGGGTGDVIKITADIKIIADGVTVSGFTIKNSGNNYWDGGVEICSHNNTISDNIIKSNNDGIYIWGGSRNNVIKNNIIEDNNESGIDISMVISSVIENNEISNTTEGTGLIIEHSHNILIRKNNISNNKIGLAVLDCGIVSYPFPCQDRVRNNNFFNNSIHAGVFDRGRAYGQSFLCVRFFHNYWGRTMMLPKIILTLESPDLTIRFPCNIDLFPALTPINN